METHMKEMEKRKVLSEVALGNISPDTLITNGTLFNVFTKEFIKKQSIWIKDGMIAYVGPDHDPPNNGTTQLIDADGMVLLPGLIESHTHIFNKSGIEELIRHVIPSGITTIVTETEDFGIISGKESIEYISRNFEGQPIRLYYTLPPFCCLTPSLEINAPTDEEFLSLLRDPKCLGIGEIYWGNIFLEGQQGERLRKFISFTLDLGKSVEGHGAGAAGRKLQAYTAFGVSSDHEPITEDEVLERLRHGYWTMIREGSVRKELTGVKEIFNKKVDFRRLILASDGIDPEELLEEGYLKGALKRALKLGVPPELAYQMVTINVAEHFHLDHLIGSLAPGKMADILLIPSPDEFSPQLVICDGKIIFRDGKTIAETQKVFFPDDMFNTVNVQDHPLPSFTNKGRVRVIELVTNLVTRESIIDLEDSEESKDTIMVFALDRIGNGGGFMGFLKGYGLQRGACGSTLCWDTIDMIVLGCDQHSIETVIHRLKEIKGGYVYAIGGEVIAEFSAPICGFISLKSLETIKEELKQLEKSLKGNGVKLEKPLLTLDILGSPAIPHLRITHDGYVRLKDRKVLPVEV
jgi:adenine deaminase